MGKTFHNIKEIICRHNNANFQKFSPAVGLLFIFSHEKSVLKFIQIDKFRLKIHESKEGRIILAIS